jgi:hypothetical protein
MAGPPRLEEVDTPVTTPKIKVRSDEERRKAGVKEGWIEVTASYRSPT